VKAVMVSPKPSPKDNAIVVQPVSKRRCLVKPKLGNQPDHSCGNTHCHENLGACQRLNFDRVLVLFSHGNQRAGGQGSRDNLYLLGR